jgi:hypothetical protein
MCKYLAEYFFKMNHDIRTSSDYKVISEAILSHYEVLDGIVKRTINQEYEKMKSGAVATKPKPYVSLHFYII